MKRAFSLIEAMIVVAILAIIAAIAIPNLLEASKKQKKEKEAIESLKKEAKARKISEVQNGPKFVVGEVAAVLDTGQEVKVLECIKSDKTFKYVVRQTIRKSFGKVEGDLQPAITVYEIELGKK